MAGFKVDKSTNFPWYRIVAGQKLKVQRGQERLLALSLNDFKQITETFQIRESIVPHRERQEDSGPLVTGTLGKRSRDEGDDVDDDDDNAYSDDEDEEETIAEAKVEMSASRARKKSKNTSRSKGKGKART